jgi:hypothetical protein
MLASHNNREICAILEKLRLPKNLQHLLIDKNILQPIYEQRTQSLLFFYNEKYHSIPIKNTIHMIKYIQYSDNKDNILYAYGNILYDIINEEIEYKKTATIDNFINNIKSHTYNNIKTEITLVEINKHTKFTLNNVPFTIEKHGFCLPLIREFSNITGYLYSSDIILNTMELQEKLKFPSESSLISGYLRIYRVKTEFLYHLIRTDYLLEIVIKKIIPSSHQTTNVYTPFICNDTYKINNFVDYEI